jgi:hypothetical protein
MKDIDEVRRENMRQIERELGSPAIAAKAIGMELAQYLNLRNGAKDSKTGIPRGMRKSTARKIEDGAKKPSGWLDIDHELFSGEERFLMAYRQLNNDRKAAAEQMIAGLLASQLQEKMVKKESSDASS